MGLKINRTKHLFVIFLVFSIILSFTQNLTDDLFFEDSAQKLALESALDQAMERETHFMNFIYTSRQTLKALSQNQSFIDYLDTGKSEEEIVRWFRSFAWSYTDFMQLRYIDKDGMEKIRIDRDREGLQPHLIPKERLQNKSDRYYFSESRIKPLGEVWFSALDLNIENGKVDIPFRPTLRAILPIEHDGKFGGILIINYLMEDFLGKLMNMPLYDSILCDDSGYPLYHYGKGKSWGFYTEPKFNIAQQFPDEYRQILSRPTLITDSFVARRFDLPIEGGLHLILQLKHSYLKSQNEQSLYQYFTTTILNIVFSIFMSFFVVRLFSNTLFDLGRVRHLYRDLKKLHLRNDIALKASGIGIWEWDYESGSLTWDEQMYQIYGIKKGDENTYGVWISMIEDADRPLVEENLRNAMQNMGEFAMSFWIVTSGGKRKYIKALGMNEYDDSGIAVRMVGTSQDISASKKTREMLTEQKAELESIFDTVQGGIIVVDLNTRILRANRKFSEQVGYTPEELIGMKCLDMVVSEDRPLSFKVMSEVMERGYYENFERRCVTKSGDIRYMTTSIALMPNKKEYLLTSVDNTDLHKAYEMIREQAYTDELTGAKNRKAYNEKLRELLALWERYEAIFSFVILDIDLFKSINDTYGHDTGDRVLVDLSALLERTTRITDHIFRIGGEEFVVLLPGTDKEGAMVYSENMRKKVEAELRTIDERVITISVGVTEVQSGDTENSIYRRADEKLYFAKEHGRNRVVSDI